MMNGGEHTPIHHAPPLPPHPWMAVPYPAPMMMAAGPPPHFMYHSPTAVNAAAGIQATEDENKTIWVGDLHYWMDENYLHSCFGHTGEVSNIKVIRNKQNGQSEGYGFVEFFSHAAAEKVLQTFSGHAMPNSDQPFRLNWASFSMGERRADAASDHSIFVGDLAPDVTDSMLQEIFVSKFPSVKGAKVVIDSTTGRSKGYGFVRFGDDKEKAQAMTEMNGVFCSSRPMRIGAATPRKSGSFGSNTSSMSGAQSDGDSTNTTVFVGGLDPNVSEDQLKQSFSQYGDIASVKIPVGKQCGFVQFVQRKNAEEALQGMNGTVIGKQTVRLSWGRNPANKQREYGNGWNGIYYGGQMYNGYGFAIPPQDPSSMYAAVPYGPYPMYGSQQQVS